MSKNTIYIINGANLNMLGIRESSIYGNTSLKQLEDNLTKQAKNIDLNIEFYSSNQEGDIINFIHKSHNDKNCVGIIINPTAHSHYSIAILDALNSVDTPSIEVHISNVHHREEFRHNLLTAKGSMGTISGLGINGYTLALIHFKSIL